MSKNFIAVDVETANSDRSSICQIGLVHVRDANIQDRKRILVNPECYFCYIQIKIHGIRRTDVEHEPTMPNVWEEIQTRTKGFILMSHSEFNFQAFSSVAEKYGLPKLNVRWADSKVISNKVWPGLRSYGLAYLAKKFGISFQHHDALEDAEVAAKIVIRALGESNTDMEEWVQTRQHGGRKTRPASHKITYQSEQSNARISLANENVLFTGTLRDRDRKKIPRSRAKELVRACGGNPLDSLSKDITMLVVGEQDQKVIKGRKQSGTHRKVLKWKGQGQKIKIRSTQDFLKAVSEE